MRLIVLVTEARPSIRYGMLRKFARVAAWTLLAFIVYATLSPIGSRPGGEGNNVLQYLGAYAVLGTLFTLAHPRRLWMVAVIVLGSAVVLEALQLLTPDRHARVVDATLKVAGGVAGLAAGALFNRRASD